MIFHLLDKHPLLSASLTRRLNVYCWQSFVMSQGSSWWLSGYCGYSALSAHLGLLNLVASFLMSSWVQKKYQTWSLTDTQQTSYLYVDALLSNLKCLLLLCHPSVIPATPFLSSPRIFTEFYFLSVEMYYVSLTFCIKSCPYPTLFQSVSWLCGWGTPPYPILSFWSP